METIIIYYNKNIYHKGKIYTTREKYIPQGKLYHKENYTTRKKYTPQGKNIHHKENYIINIIYLINKL